MVRRKLRILFDRLLFGFIVSIAPVCAQCDANYNRVNSIQMKEWEDSLSNEYGNLLLRQSTFKGIHYIFYRVNENKEGIFTLVTVDSDRNNFSVKQSKNKDFNRKRYNPEYKYTTPITSTNNKYLLDKFHIDIDLSEGIMNVIISCYLSSEESIYFNKLQLFRSINSILPVFHQSNKKES